MPRPRRLARRARARPFRGETDDRPLNFAVLFDNVPELLFLLGGAALSGHVLVALNTTRSVDELARDASATHAGLVVHEPAYAGSPPPSRDGWAWRRSTWTRRAGPPPGPPPRWVSRWPGLPVRRHW